MTSPSLTPPPGDATQNSDLDSSVFGNEHQDAQPSVARRPAEAFPLGHYLEEEMAARGWTSEEVALRMGGRTIREIAIDHLCVEMTLAVHDPNLILDEATANKLARAFGVSAELFLNLDRYYREWATTVPQTVAGDDATTPNTDSHPNTTVVP